MLPTVNLISNTRLKSKKLLILLIIVMISVVILIPAIIFFYSKPSEKLSKETTKIHNQALSYNSIDITRVNESLDKVNNLKLSQNDRYEALRNIYTYFSSAYSVSHDPAIRNYASSTLNQFAKDNFPNNYVNGEFDIPCADPTCGHQFDSEVKQALDEVAKSSLPDYAKNTISKNLQTTGYIPDKDQALFGFTLVVGDLERYGKPEASATAQLLRNYVKNKYKTDL